MKIQFFLAIMYLTGYWWQSCPECPLMADRWCPLGQGELSCYNIESLTVDHSIYCVWRVSLKSDCGPQYILCLEIVSKVWLWTTVYIVFGECLTVDHSISCVWRVSDCGPQYILCLCLYVCTSKTADTDFEKEYLHCTH